MLIYNTTFHVEEDIHQNFLIWLQECFIPDVLKNGTLRSPRLCNVLSHQEEGLTFTLQWEVDNSALLHKWHIEQGSVLNKELNRIFRDKVVGFPTLMEIIE